MHRVGSRVLGKSTPGERYQPEDTRGVTWKIRTVGSMLGIRAILRWRSTAVCCRQRTTSQDGKTSETGHSHIRGRAENFLPNNERCCQGAEDRTKNHPNGTRRETENSPWNPFPEVINRKDCKIFPAFSFHIKGYLLNILWL